MNKKLEWTTVQKKINELVPQTKNPRKMSAKQTADLKRSLKNFGLVEIPVIDTDNTLLAGHQRLRVMILLEQGEDKIDVRIPNRKLTEEERDKYMIASNAISGSWDFEKLKVFSPDLLLDVGFDPIDLSKIWDKDIAVEDDNFDEQKELEKIKKTDIELGDVIVMGQHRLICNDSTKKETLQKLFSDERCAMIYSDPIYNIDLDYNKGVGGKQNYGGSVQDKRTDAEYTELMRKSLECALSVSHEDTHVFYWADQSYVWLFQTLYKELGIQNKRVCLWVKNGFSPTPSVAFNKAYEPCIYGVRGKPFLTARKDLMEILNKDIGNGNATLDDIWAVKRLSSSKYKHATSKPPQLHEKAILRCTKPTDIILDSFAGSGSTLIACEQLKRRAYCVELEPIFCELIKGRWEKLTGKKAKIIKAYEKPQKETVYTTN
jgi:DNA modification methylase